MYRCPNTLFAALLLALAGLSLTGCLDDVEPMPDPAGGGADAEMPEPEPDPEPDPEYRRTCERGDFDCTFDQCNEAGTDGPLGCFKRCEPNNLAAVGQRHPECDEPERPFCSEAGLWQGGDYGCNGCVYLCTAVPQAARCQSSGLSCW